MLLRIAVPSVVERLIAEKNIVVRGLRPIVFFYALVPSTNSIQSIVEAHVSDDRAMRSASTQSGALIVVTTVVSNNCISAPTLYAKTPRVVHVAAYAAAEIVALDKHAA